MTALVLLAVQATVPHTFVYTASETHEFVYLAGTFNGWSTNAEPMKPDPSRHTWMLTKRLLPGRYEYKFVLDGKTWITDPKGQDVSDGNGHTNSLLLLVPPGYETPASESDGRVTPSGLAHLQKPPYLNYDQNKLTLSLQTRVGDVAKARVLANGQSFPMLPFGHDELYERFRAQIPYHLGKNLHYRFQVYDQKWHDFGPAGLDNPKLFSVEAASFRPVKVPSWVQGTVFYQIFPDRFANGNPKNDPPETVPWTAKPTYFNYFGGDLAGIRNHETYLKQLGISGIYVNPIFEGPTNHGYETSDYYHVATRLGTNRELIDLVASLHRQGIRTVLDGVFNHSATSFFAFADILKKGQESPYRNWYWIHSYPVKVADPPNYTAWFNFPSLPKIHLDNPPTKAYFLKVATYWPQIAHIDGWRLDVGNEVSQDYWKAFRQVVKSNNPNTWIVGENWGDGSPWLTGDQWDSQMGYQFREATLQFVAHHVTKPSQYLGKLMQIYDSYAPQVSRNLMSLLGSHDTTRFLNECGGDKDLALLGATFQFTWPGAPSIYYGDELGMEGGVDPDNRRGMDWTKADPQNPFLKHYKKLIALKKRPEFTLGEPKVLLIDDANDTLAFIRSVPGKVALVIANRSNTPRTITLANPSTKTLYDAFTGREYRKSGRSLAVKVASKSALILVQKP